MSFFVSKEIEELIDTKSLDSDNNIIDVLSFVIDGENILLKFYTSNLKEHHVINKFLFCEKEYKLTKDLKFKTMSLQKHNTNIVAEIYTNKDEFWSYLENEK